MKYTYNCLLVGMENLSQRYMLLNKDISGDLVAIVYGISDNATSENTREQSNVLGLMR